jgi:transcription elongation factor Elf1
MNLLTAKLHLDILRQTFKPCPHCGLTSEYVCRSTVIDPTAKRWKISATCTHCGNTESDILFKPLLGVL